MITVIFKYCLFANFIMVPYFAIGHTRAVCIGWFKQIDFDSEILRSETIASDCAGVAV